MTRGDGPGGPFTATTTLVRHLLRLDRVRLVIWIGAVVAVTAFSAQTVMDMYGDPLRAAEYARLVAGNPTLKAISGPGLGLEDANVGAVLVNETTQWVSIALAVMSLFLLVRHTRSEEESERADLIRAAAVGRHAPLGAALVVVAAANLVAGAVLAAVVAALGYPLVGSVAYGASLAASGLVFTGVGAVVAQVAASGRAALGGSIGVLGVAYALRALGDVRGGALSWWSPLSWPHLVRAYAGEEWWVLGLSLVVATVLVAVAGACSVRRDLGTGMVGQRLGPAGARPSLTPRGGLALRMQRSQVLVWSVGLFLLGVVYGSFGSDIEQLFEDNPEFSDFIAQVGASLVDSYVGYTLVLGAVMTGAFAVASVLRLHSEEAAGRAELMLAGPLGRYRWAWSHLWITVVGCVVLLAASGAGTGLGLAFSLRDSGQLLRATGASLSYVPAVLVVAGVAVVVVGTTSRWATLAWVPLAIAVVVALFGDLLSLPRAIRWLSPFEHTSVAPAERVDALALALLCAVAVAAGGAGLMALRRRDLGAA